VIPEGVGGVVALCCFAGYIEAHVGWTKDAHYGIDELVFSSGTESFDLLPSFIYFVLVNEI
jgi:hypothetical protein